VKQKDELMHCVFQTIHQAEGVTGILLIYPSYVVHLLESSIDVIYAILKDLQHVTTENEGLLIDPKILTISHDVPTRYS